MSRKDGDKFEAIAEKILNKHSKYKIISTTINSGAFWHSKGDRVVTVNSVRFLVEIKGTRAEKYRVTSKITEKIWNEAFDRNLMPLLLVLVVKKRKKYLAVITIMKNKKINEKINKSFVLTDEKLNEMIGQYWTERVRTDETDYSLRIEVLKED